MLSHEAEYIIDYLSACQEPWMVNLINDIEGKNHGAMYMRIDNMYAINLAKNSITLGRRKYIEMRLYYLIEQVSNGWLCLDYCRSENQIADIMTKFV